jgi:hypothetical protein
MSCSGHAGVCFKPPTGQGFEDMQAEVMKLLAMDGTGGFRKAEDSYGYHWLVIESADIEELVTQVHLVNSSLADAGWGPQLLCSCFGLAQLPHTDDTSSGAGGSEGASGALPEAMPETTAGPGRVLRSTAYLVYLFKRGTFYPFAPDGKEHRNLEEELRLRSLVADDLTIETDLDRWFPLWDLPVG